MSTATAKRPAAISDDSRRMLARVAAAATLIVSSLVMLIAGILIGNAARKRIDRWSHGIT
jgi:hypothetical protein